MGFEKKWTDEQDKRILELHKRISNKEISKEFKITPENVSKRVSYLKSLKKQKKKTKNNHSPKGRKNRQRMRESRSPTDTTQKEKLKDKKIEVLTAPTHAEADEFTKEYATKPINSEEPQEEMPVEILDTEKPTPEAPQVNWSLVSNSLTLTLNARFKANNLVELTEEEKVHFSNALNEVLKNRVELFSKYADLIALGLAGFSILTPRILEFLDREKQKKITKEASATIDLTKTPQAPPVVDEQAEAQRRFEALQSPHG